jgi:hypothetical protein
VFRIYEIGHSGIAEMNKIKGHDMGMGVYTLRRVSLRRVISLGRRMPPICLCRRLRRIISLLRRWIVLVFSHLQLNQICIRYGIDTFNE